MTTHRKPSDAQAAEAMAELATLTPAQLAYLIEHHTNLAEYDEHDATAEVAFDIGDGLPPSETAAVHQTMVRLMEVIRGQ